MYSKCCILSYNIPFSCRSVIIENDILTSLHDLEKDVNAVNYNVRGIDDGIRMNRSTEANIEKLLDDYKKLKVENEVLLERIQSYKEKYEKK